MSTARFAPFPETHWSVFHRGETTGDRRREALEELAHLYWRPVYAYIRARWNRSGSDAMDTTQDFFLRLLDGRLIEGADPTRGRFRSYLKAALDNFVLNEIRAGQAQLRGGDRLHLALGPDVDPERLVSSRAGESPQDALDRNWRRATLDEALRRLEAVCATEGRSDAFTVFQRYDLAPERERPSYEELAREMGLTHDGIDTRLRRMRKDLLAVVREVLSVTVSDPTSLEEEVDDFFRGRV